MLHWKSCIAFLQMKRLMGSIDYPMNKKERNAFGLTDRDMKTLQDIFDKYPEVKSVFVFGSRAKGTYKQGSDIDLAVMNQGVKDAVIDKMKSDFEDSSLPYIVDLINYHTLKHQELKVHIDRVGVSFYKKLEGERGFKLMLDASSSTV